MAYVTIDNETCGLHGPIVLLQWGEGDDGPVHLHSVWKEKVRDTMRLIERIANNPDGVLGFNLAFDWFKYQQTYTTLALIDPDRTPEEQVEEYALAEPRARDGPCVKPHKAMDLMLHARKGPYQSLMGRDDIVIRKVPTVIAKPLAFELERRVNFPDIFFAKRQDGGRGARWRVRPRPEAPEWSDVILKFSPSSALKALATHELGLDPAKTLLFSDVEVNKKFQPEEAGAAPFALAVGKPGQWNGAWPDVIAQHIAHWAFNPLARDYATKDIEYPRLLWIKWGRPAFGDVDSDLACLVGSQRWKGYAVDVEGIEALRAEAEARRSAHPIAGKRVMSYLREMLSDEEAMALTDEDGKPSTKKVILEELSKMQWCPKCSAAEAHGDCELAMHPVSRRAKGVLSARKAKKDLELYDKLIMAGRFMASANPIGAKSSRMSGGQVNEGKRAKKTKKSKAGKKGKSLNPHAVQKRKAVREKFPLAFSAEAVAKLNVVGGVSSVTSEPEELWGGDFESFEVGIADAVYNDPQLNADLVECEPPCTDGGCKFSNEVCTACGHEAHSRPCEHRTGRGAPTCACAGTKSEFRPKCSRCTGKPSKPRSIKIHAIVGTLCYPHAKCGGTCGRPEGCTDYWFIKATSKGDEESNLKKLGAAVPDLYTRAKSAFFALIYFGNAYTLATRLGIPTDDGEAAYQKIMARYPVMARKRNDFVVRFGALAQEGGIGSRITWKDPEDSQPSMLGFNRFFTSENCVMRALFELAQDPPPEWRSIQVKVQRRGDRWQLASGAVQSALYAAAFQVQGANIRAAGNHIVQSTGAQITKELQWEIWQVQPPGVHPWLVRPLNVHDELMNPTHPSVVDRVADIQKRFVEKRRKLIPLLGMAWDRLGNWADK